MTYEKISVCVPAYNEEKTIYRCLNSITCQDDINICEILVGINSSTDETKKIVESFGKKDKRVKCIDSAKGKANAWNALNKAAQNDLRIFQDGDSVVPSHGYKYLISKLYLADIVGGSIEKQFVNNDFLVRIGNFPKRHTFLEPKLNGCLYAFKYSKLANFLLKKLNLNEMPPNIINDDVFLNMVVDKVIVSDKVFVKVDAELSFQDMLSRYKRIEQGNYQLKIMYPEIYMKRIAPFNKGKSIFYYLNIYRLSSNNEKLLLFPIMILKFIIFRYIYYNVCKNNIDCNVVKWK